MRGRRPHRTISQMAGDNACPFHQYRFLYIREALGILEGAVGNQEVLNSCVKVTFLLYAALFLAMCFPFCYPVCNPTIAKSTENFEKFKTNTSL
jgi:hypothetical protein